MFLTIRHDILKQIKQTKTDAKLFELRRIKLVRTLITLSACASRIKLSAQALKVKRERRIAANLWQLKGFRVILQFRAYLRGFGVPIVYPDPESDHEDMELTYRSGGDGDSYAMEPVRPRKPGLTDAPEHTRLKRPGTDMGSIHWRRYLKPCLRFVYASSPTHANNYARLKEMMRGFLYEMNKKNQIKIKIRITGDTVVGF